METQYHKIISSCNTCYTFLYSYGIFQQPLNIYRESGSIFAGMRGCQFLNFDWIISLKALLFVSYYLFLTLLRFLESFSIVI